MRVMGVVVLLITYGSGECLRLRFAFPFYQRLSHVATTKHNIDKRRSFRDIGGVHRCSSQT